MLPRNEQIRFDDRRPDRPSVGLNAKPPVLRRRTVTILAVLVVAGVIYGTLVPFNFVRHSELGWRIPWVSFEPGDAAANVLVYIPLGIALRLVFRRRGSWWPTECLGALTLACGISYAAEVLQQWLPGRVPTLSDTFCNGLGALIGTIIAPPVQRRLRQFHAWFHHALQTTPFVATAGLLNAFICVYALAPFDLHISPSHVLASLGRFQASCAAELFSSPGLSPAAVLNKWMGAAAYGLLAFLLVMAGRETGRSLRASFWHGLTRSCGLVAAVELLQMFTASHVADCQDVYRGWACCVVVTTFATLLLCLRPLIYRDPIAMIGPVLPIACPVLVAWLTVSAVKSFDAGESNTLRWLPVMASFNRSWDALLVNYTGGFINYVLAVAAIMAWLRSRGQTPRLVHCFATALAAALSLQAISVLLLGSWPDTGHIALAMVAAITVHSMDRAIFGGRSLTTASGPQVGWDGTGLSLDDSRREENGLEPTLPTLRHPDELTYGGSAHVKP